MFLNRKCCLDRCRWQTIMLEMEGQVQNLRKLFLDHRDFHPCRGLAEGEVLRGIGRKIHTACPAALPLAQAH